MNEFGQEVVKGILIPSSAWKVGKPNLKIRKSALICMIRILENHLVDKQKLYEIWKEIFNVVKGCIDDDYATDLRFTGIVLLRHMIENLHEEFDDEDYRLIYPELLKRLDDS